MKTVAPSSLYVAFTYPDVRGNHSFHIENVVEKEYTSGFRIVEETHEGVVYEFSLPVLMFSDTWMKDIDNLLMLCIKLSEYFPRVVSDEFSVK